MEFNLIFFPHEKNQEIIVLCKGPTAAAATFPLQKGAHNLLMRTRKKLNELAHYYMIYVAS